MYKIESGTPKEVVNEVQKLSDMMFQANSMLDNIVYSLSIDFNAIKFGSFVHLVLSHSFPKLSDNIIDFGILKGDRFYRKALMANDNTEEKMSTYLEQALTYIIDIEGQVNKAIDKAIEFDSKSYEDFLRTFNVDEIPKYKKQLMVFIVALKDYEDNGTVISKWNKDFTSFIIDEFKGDWKAVNGSSIAED